MSSALYPDRHLYQPILLHNGYATVKSFPWDNVGGPPACLTAP